HPVPGGDGGHGGVVRGPVEGARALDAGVLGAGAVHAVELEGGARGVDQVVARDVNGQGGGRGRGGRGRRGGRGWSRRVRGRRSRRGSWSGRHGGRGGGRRDRRDARGVHPHVVHLVVLGKRRRVD